MWGGSKQDLRSCCSHSLSTAVAVPRAPGSSVTQADGAEVGRCTTTAAVLPTSAVPQG